MKLNLPQLTTDCGRNGLSDAKNRVHYCNVFSINKVLWFNVIPAFTVRKKSGQIRPDLETLRGNSKST